MTDSAQTVPVPVDLLKRIEAQVYYGTSSPLRELRRYIPTPPKVGDVLTEEQIKALPPRSVLRDSDGDVWVTGIDRLAMVAGTSYLTGAMHVDLASADEVAEYDPVLVSLPDPEDRD